MEFAREEKPHIKCEVEFNDSEANLNIFEPDCQIEEHDDLDLGSPKQEDDDLFSSCTAQDNGTDLETKFLEPCEDVDPDHINSPHLLDDQLSLNLQRMKKYIRKSIQLTSEAGDIDESRTEENSEHLNIEETSYSNEIFSKDGVQSDTKESQFACDLCGKTFKCRYYLRKHKIIHSDTKDFFCEICGKDFRRKSSLQQHYRCHSGERPYACDLCEKAFKDSSTLKKHRLIHFDKQYTCEVCGRAFTQRSHFQDHCRLHSEDKPYQCDQCGHLFISLKRLQMHSVIHDKGRPSYPCDECGKHLATKSSFRIHKKNVHNKEKLFTCESCDTNICDE